MNQSGLALRIVSQEVAGLIGRVQSVRPFSLHETMVPAAMPRTETLREVDEYLLRGRAELLRAARRFLAWLGTAQAEHTSITQVHKRYVFLRLRANIALTQLDLFADAISQRSESGTGVFLAGLDVLARDALDIAGAPYTMPKLLCYLDRGLGAAIRRARTRLPGGGDNPVSVIRIPRERMIGFGIASSLVHEVGHQGAALLELVPALRSYLEPKALDPHPENPWRYWWRWISEIVADLWSVARLGIASTLGLMNVVSLPRVFVFRSNSSDPHPTPWVRLMLSAEMGRRLYPHPHWQRVQALWQEFYPAYRGSPGAAHVHRLAHHASELVDHLMQFSMPGALTLKRLLHDPGLSVDRLDELAERWFRHGDTLRDLRPCHAFGLAAYCQLTRGRTPVPEIPLLSSLLTHWAQPN